ncbi:MAG: alpha/beta hydrolase [Bacteroidota bacterium]
MKYLLLLLTLISGLGVFAQERFVSLNDANIRVYTMGLESRQPGQPVIVFESGYGTPLGHWDTVLEGAAELAPVVAYDRPGLGKSEAVDYEPTLKNVADRLVSLLSELDVPPPYVLVGHSLGGVYVRGFATYHPEKLAGLVIVDPGDFTETWENQRGYYDVLDWDSTRVDSLMRSFVARRMARRGDAVTSMQKEGNVLEALRKQDFAEIHARPLPDIPVHILMGGRYDVPIERRPKEYDGEALFRSKTQHRAIRWMEVADSVSKGMFLYAGDAGHFVHRDDPQLVISSLKLVLADFKLLREKND